MTADERQTLTAEKAAIEARLAAAPEAEKDALQRTYGERLAHLSARLDTAKPAKPKT